MQTFPENNLFGSKIQTYWWTLSRLDWRHLKCWIKQECTDSSDGENYLRRNADLNFCHSLLKLEMSVREKVWNIWKAVAKIRTIIIISFDSRVFSQNICASISYLGRHGKRLNFQLLQSRWIYILYTGCPPLDITAWSWSSVYWTWFCSKAVLV